MGRARRIARWSGAAVCAALFAAWAISLRSWTHLNSDLAQLGLTGGEMYFSPNWYGGRKSHFGWVDRREWWPPNYGGLRWPQVYVRGAGPQRAWIVAVPIWIPFSLAALP